MTDLNQELIRLSPDEFTNTIDAAINSLSTEITDFSLSTATRANIINIARICTKFGIINQPKASAPINRNPDARQRLILYTARWLKKLVSNRNRSFTLKEAPPLSARDTVRDPALTRVLERYYLENKIPVTANEIDIAIDSHDLLMSIENIQGHLLEEYIARNICVAPFNFIWLEGEIVKAADFALYLPAPTDQPDEEDTIYLLQIKNKYNTENSSSVTVRDGTAFEIAKWYRLGKRKSNGVNIPVYKWTELNDIIQEFTGHSPNLNEADYFSFLDNVMHINPKLINI